VFKIGQKTPVASGEYRKTGTKSPCIGDWSAPMSEHGGMARIIMARFHE